MSRFRANHQKSTIHSSRGRVIRFVLMLVILGVLVWQGQKILADMEYGVQIEAEQEESNVKSTGSSPTGELIQNDFFTLLYDEDHEQARWISYELTRDNLKKKRLKRLTKFDVDRTIKTGSAHTKDYSHSGYSRGHLVPSADMSYSQASMKETYKMSNISPQLSEFNGGIWRELEEQTRDWAFANEKLHIVAGPILDQVEVTIGQNDVSVPKYFFKVILDADGDDQKGIGFVFPHEISYKHLHKYAKSIDEVEKITGLDFFKGITSRHLEEELESKVHTDKWPVDNRRFELRKDQWNKTSSKK